MICLSDAPTRVMTRDSLKRIPYGNISNMTEALTGSEDSWRRTALSRCCTKEELSNSRLMGKF